VQFQTNSHLCRRCHVSLDEEIVEVAATPQPITAPSIQRDLPGHLQLAAAIRSLRHRNGLSQRQLAMRMNVPRTYVSKIENEKATPTLSSLARLARALEVTIPDLLNGPDAGPQEDVRDLLNDNFIAELLPFVSQLSAMQLNSVLAQVRDLTLRPRRSA
jgi:transcriptional regulator with XRE-family HTH domain